MRYLLRFINAILDTALAWFTPLWRRSGNEAVAQISRYINHYRPSIKPERMERLRTVRANLKESLLYWRKDEVLGMVEDVKNEFGALRNGWVEVVESLFVITVVFLGIRTYFVQPFRIPTNSMWPSLNGIVVHPVDEIPGRLKRWADMLVLGSSYVDVSADAPKQIVNVSENRKWLILTETVLTFSDDTELRVPSASGAVMQYLRDSGKAIDTPRGLFFLPYRAGETIMRARVDAGDMVLVNRVAYHFRHPRRGETFVFDTRGINTSSSSMKDQSGGTHFIKRLCGVPGDSIRIESPNLIVNGAPASEPGIARVEAGQPPYNTSGYVALNPRRMPPPYLPEGRTVQLSLSTPQRPWLREYLALGDNTLNSLDSRYWGPVHQFNVLGPASFTLWPFTRHWGLID